MAAETTPADRTPERRARAAPCSSACRTSRAARPRRRSTRTKRRRASAASRSTSRASSTGRTTSSDANRRAGARLVACGLHGSSLTALARKLCASSAGHGGFDGQKFVRRSRAHRGADSDAVSAAVPRARVRAGCTLRSRSRLDWRETPVAALARHMRVLADSPKDFLALIGAGKAALALGDTQAAAGFFGRADEVYPASPLPQAGMGAALRPGRRRDAARCVISPARSSSAPLRR